MKYWRNGIFAALLGVLAIGAQAEELCATVKIEIAQEVSLLRQGFEATMKIHNSLTGVENTIAVEDISLQFYDDTSLTAPMAAAKISSATNSEAAGSDCRDSGTACFFVRKPVVNADVAGLVVSSNPTAYNVTAATIAAGKSGEFNWLIVPARGLTDVVTSSAGKKYWLGATLTYTFQGKREMQASPFV